MKNHGPLSKPAYAIYALTNVEGAVFYVGATCDISRRMREHKKALGYRPSFVILESGEGRWVEPEQKWINHFRSIGALLLNKTAGGNGAQTHSAETRAKLSLIGRERKKPDGFGERLSAASKGKPRNWSADGEKRVKKTQIDGTWNAKHAAKLSRSKKAFWAALSEEEKNARMAKMRAARWPKTG